MRPLHVFVLAASIWGISSSWAVDKFESHKLNVITSIFRVEAPSTGETDYRVLSTVDGRIYKVAGSNEIALKLLNLAATTGSNVELLLVPGNADLIGSVEVVAASRADAFTLMNWEKARTLDIEREAKNRENRLDEEFRPTVVANKAEAQELFDSVYSYNSGYDVEDHCYDRAHYWARSFYVNDKVKSQKVFLFFTSKYQREHNYKWWFHVAPFVLSGNSKREYVLDPTFETEALTMKQWSLDFADKAKSCIDGANIGVYYDQGEKEDCVLIRASMYHYTPSDLNTVPSVTSWRCADLKRVMSGIPAPYKKTWDDVRGFLPAECR